MRPLLARVRRSVRRFDLWPPGAPVAVALSGGSDSVALLRLLRALDEAGDLRLAGAIHVNHQLRGEASEQDEAFCRDLAGTLGIPLRVERVDASRGSGSREAVARRLRYAALEGAAAPLGVVRIATGHTRDDQAETVLAKLLRGAGPAGLGGIYPRRDGIVRPLLECGREELRVWLRAEGQAWCEDASNLDRGLTRNRIRHDLLPALERDLAPGVGERLARMADLMREDAALLDALAADRAAGVVVRHGPLRIELDRAALAALPPALARRVIRLALRDASADRWAGTDEVSCVQAILAGERGGADLPGARVEPSGRGVVLWNRDPGAEVAPFHYPLPVPGTVWIPEAGCRIVAEREAGYPPGEAPAGPTGRVVVPEAAVAAPLGVRSWRPGDRVRPLGLGGRKKLQDLFVDRKVPRADRARVPVVVDARDRILWIPGHAASEDFRVTDPAKPVVVLRLTRSGGTF